jgi:hypothetical protein
MSLAEHSDPVFAELGMIEDTVRLFGGHLIMPTANAATKRCSKATLWCATMLPAHRRVAENDLRGACRPTS